MQAYYAATLHSVTQITIQDGGMEPSYLTFRSEIINAPMARPVQGKMLMVVIDTHVMWPEISIVENTTAEETVN